MTRPSAQHGRRELSAACGFEARRGREKEEAALKTAVAVILTALALMALTACGSLTGTCSPHGRSVTLVLSYPQNGTVNRAIFTKVYVALTTPQGVKDRTLRMPGKITIGVNNSQTITVPTGVSGVTSCTFKGTN